MSEIDFLKRKISMLQKHNQGLVNDKAQAFNDLYKKYNESIKVIFKAREILQAAGYETGFFDSVLADYKNDISRACKHSLSRSL